MSMNFFLKAFTQQDIEAMVQSIERDKDDDNYEEQDLIDEWVWGDNSRYLIEEDVETAWDVLENILDGAGFQISSFVEFALSNGCSIVHADLVKQQAEKLSHWTKAQVLEKLRNLDPAADLYHQRPWQENENWLLEQFDKLAAFYQEAAEKNLGVVFYVA
ncbi:hypothetical protein DOJK_00173 [Patescibacteria group bacterium]|nr:hypothetical protein DOJK_00173 [Patescibacteria group bacterium]